MPTGHHYLNCAYMAPLSRAVQAAGVAGIRTESEPHFLGAPDFFRAGDEARGRFADILGVPEPERVALVPSVSYAMATVARNTALQKGQNVVTLHEQFPSNAHVWRRLVAECEAELRVVRPPADGPDRPAAWNGAILDAIDADTALVAIGPVHWSDGTPFDLVRIGARAREVGAALAVDGTQSVGALPFDMDRIQPDVLVCAGYKWLMGPYSAGLAYYGARYDDGVPLEETWRGKRGSQDFATLGNQTTEYRDGAARYDAGEAGSFILLPMLNAALEQISGWGVDRVCAYVQTLRDELLGSERLVALGVDTREVGSPHLFGLRLPPAEDPERVRAHLESLRVHVSVRGRVVRVSPHVYNDADDLEALLGGLEAALG